MIVKEHIESLSEDMMGPAWRWLILRNADTEDKMVQILRGGDRQLYHKVKSYEIAKSEDQLFNEFSVDLRLFLHFEKHFKLREEESTVDFVKELDLMIEAKEQSFFGTEARLTLWEKVAELGPIMYESYTPENSSDRKYRLHISSVCHILELIDSICTPRLKVLRQRLLETRREAFSQEDWEKHSMCIQTLSF